MKKIQTVIIFVSLLTILLILNTWLTITVCFVFPNFLIHNKSYLPAHRAMTSFLVTNRIGKLGDLIHQDELDHIRDVKRTIDNVTKYTLVIFAVLIFFRKTVITRLATYSKWGIYLIAGGGVAALLFFEPFFIKFHELLFPQGNWSFPENSILIQLYPEYFWQTAAGIIFLATILELAAFFKLARKYQQQTTALF